MFVFSTLPPALVWCKVTPGEAIKQTQQHDATVFNIIPEFHNYGKLPQQKTVLSFITAVKAHQLFVFHRLSDTTTLSRYLTPTHLVWVTFWDTSVLFDTTLVNAHHLKTSLSCAISHGMKHFLYKISGTEQKRQSWKFKFGWVYHVFKRMTLLSKSWPGLKVFGHDLKNVLQSFATSGSLWNTLIQPRVKKLGH